MTMKAMSNAITCLILLLVFLVLPDDLVEYPEPSGDATATNDEPET